MNKFKTVLVVITSLILLGIIVVFGISYAFFVTGVSTPNATLATSGKLNVIYIADGDVSGSLVPSSTKEGGISTVARIKLGTDSVASQATLSLKINDLSSELAIAGLKWEVYKNSEITPYSQGTFLNKVAGETIDIVTDYNLTTSETIFTLYIWLNGNESGNETMNKSFRATLGATADVGGVRKALLE